MLKILNQEVIQTANIHEAQKAFLQQRWDNLAGMEGYEPLRDGYAVFLTEDEARERLTDLNLDFKLEELCFEGGWLDNESGLYNLVCIPGNSFGWEFIIPHSETFNTEQLPWLASVVEDGIFNDN